VAGADAGTWLYRALTLLVIACPCALVISTPVSIVAALSAAARNGVLFKGGAYLERLAGARVVAFDKTGTLTRGRILVDDLVLTGASDAVTVLRYAAAVEARSEHPIAWTIVAHARQRGLDVPAANDFRAFPGLGAEARVDGRLISIGNRRFVMSRGMHVPEVGDSPASTRSLVYVAADGVVLGVIALTDRPRPTARETVELLRSQGIDRIVMLTGDEGATAQAVAAAVGVDAWHHGLLPDEKHALVKSLGAEGRTVVMVGDGVNDAPALAAADVGVAMGAAASDVAIETADVALMSDELLKLPYAVRLARATLRNVRTNVAVSLVMKAAFLVLAVTGVATLWMAVLADTGASVIVVANALRLLRER
jgi:Cd2+/Zn2+-exporting ATPase